MTTEQVRAAIRDKGNQLLLGFSAIESCVDLGVMLHGFGDTEAVKKACDLAEVIAKERALGMPYRSAA